MVRRVVLLLIACVVSVHGAMAADAAAQVRLKDLGRFQGWRDNMLVGYGIVTGLAGSGDTPRNQATRQAMSNMLSQFDLVIPQDQIQSRNVAMVMITATLPPTATVGDKIDVNVTSTGDARSLAGGTLIMTPLKGPDHQVYALAQGPLVIGGYRFDANGNLRQKNHPTVGTISLGGTVEAAVRADLVASNGYLNFVLKDADATTAERIAQRINQSLGAGSATSVDAESVRIRAPANGEGLNAYVARIESLAVVPDQVSRVVINERTGTLVAGGDTHIAPITISHGDIRVSVDTQYMASQPQFVGVGGDGVRTIIVGNSDLNVEEPAHIAATYGHTTVSELVHSLEKANVSTRDIIAILQAIKAAGALHADVIVQ